MHILGTSMIIITTHSTIRFITEIITGITDIAVGGLTILRMIDTITEIIGGITTVISLIIIVTTSTVPM
jgi:hypothetical protein